MSRLTFSARLPTALRGMVVAIFVNSVFRSLPAYWLAKRCPLSAGPLFPVRSAR